MLLTVFAFFFPPNTFTISIFVCLVLSFIVEVIPLFSPNYTIYILYSISHLIIAHAYSLITANNFFAYVYLHSCVVFINIITTFRAPMASTTTLPLLCMHLYNVPCSHYAGISFRIPWGLKVMMIFSKDL